MGITEANHILRDQSESLVGHEGEELGTCRDHFEDEGSHSPIVKGVSA